MFEMGEMVNTTAQLPEGVAEMLPSPELARILAAVEEEMLSGFDRVTVVQGWLRLVSYAQAGFYRAVRGLWEVERGVAHRDYDPLHAVGLMMSSEIDDLAVSEMRAALGWTRRAAEYHLELAFLLSRLPRVEEALREGRIDLPKARVICEQTSHLDEVEAEKVAERVLSDAPRLSTGQLRVRIQRLCMEADPDSARQRYQARIVERRLVVESTEAGTAHFHGFDLAPAAANAAFRRINRLAKGLKTRGESRSLDQLRADVFIDLLCGGDTPVEGRGGAIVDIRVDLETLAGLAERAGEIPGYGPVISDVARQVAEHQEEAEWRVVVTGEGGEIIDVVTTRRRPSPGQRRWVQAVNPHCVFPTCRMPAHHCDLDHNPPWNLTGTTATRDLAPLCRHDHPNKDRGWSYRRIRPGVWEWTSPLGHTYQTGPGLEETPPEPNGPHPP